MDEKIFDELQKLYDNQRLGELVQEICEYYVTNDGFADDSSQDELEPHEIVEAVYLLFCLQCREQILDEFAIVRKKYPSIYEKISPLCDTILINMDYRALEEKNAEAIAGYLKDTSVTDILDHVETYSRSSESLSEALDKFYKYIHSKKA